VYDAVLVLVSLGCSSGVLQLRGNAGSHDLELAEGTLEALLQATTAGTPWCHPQTERLSPCYRSWFLKNGQPSVHL